MARFVFLSYSSKDDPWAPELASRLRDIGLEGWFDAFDLDSRESWLERREDALRKSDTLVLILGPHSLRSPWTFFGLGAAVADRKCILAVTRGGAEIEVLKLTPGQRNFWEAIQEFRRTHDLAPNAEVDEIFSDIRPDRADPKGEVAEVGGGLPYGHGEET